MDQPSSIGAPNGNTTTLAYDNVGPLSQQMTWDSLGRLTQVRNGDGSVTLATYTYDPLDRLRLVDYGGGTRVRFRYGGLTTSAVQTIDDATGAVIRHIGTGWGGELLADWTGSGQDIRIFGLNAHHDLTWTAGSTGAVTGSVRYDPAGVAVSVTGSVPAFRFQGSWADDVTKLAWVVTRWYAPAQGRFISEDSLTGEPRDPDSRHLYAYGAGDPVGAWDPDGRFWYKWRSVDTMASVAARWLGGSERKNAIVNTNRNRLNSTYAFSVGKCVWVPRDVWWSDRTNWGTSQCSPSSFVITGNILREPNAAIKHRAIASTTKVFGDWRAWYTLSQSRLWSVTQSPDESRAQPGRPCLHLP